MIAFDRPRARSPGKRSQAGRDRPDAIGRAERDLGELLQQRQGLLLAQEERLDCVAIAAPCVSATVVIGGLISAPLEMLVVLLALCAGYRRRPDA